MSKLSAALQSITLCTALLVLSLFGWSLHERYIKQAVGVALPQGAAVFETSLQSRISSTDTSMTLAANSVRGGGTLSGYNCFTIDEGRTDMEYVCGSVSGTSVTSLERGIDPLTASTTNSALKFAHRVGANVKITDFPLIQRMRHQLAGADTILNVLKYDASTPDCAADNEICDYGFITDLAFSGASVLDASTAAKGVVEIATQIEAASSTSAGATGALLAIPASSATSTWNSATAALRVLVSNNSGKLDNGFIATSTLFAGQSFSVGTTTMAGSLTLSGGNSTSNIASTSIKTFTSSTSPTTTWTKPSNLKYVIVKVQGGGGGGAGAGTNESGGGAGGGGGGYCEKIIPAAALGATETIAVGGAGAAGSDGTGNGTTGGQSYFGTHCIANGGVGADGDVIDTPGNGGTATGGDINRTGRTGGPSASGASGEQIPSGTGGDSASGFGGASRSSDGTGNAGVTYGGGGAGGFCDNSCSANPGGVGAVGAVFVWEVYF
jgi:hypothetical protein